MHLKKHACALFFFLLGSTAVFGGTIGAGGTVTCIAGDQQLIDWPVHPKPAPGITNYCQETGALGAFSQASFFVGYSQAANPGDYNSVKVVDSVVAKAGQSLASSSYTRNEAANTQVHYSWDFLFDTAGPTRPGYLQMNLAGNPPYSWFYNGYVGFTATLTDLNNQERIVYSCGGDDACFGGPVPAFNDKLGVTLGDVFEVNVQGNINLNGSELDGYEAVNQNFAYGFRFLEADGQTPVSVQNVYDDPVAAPEPATFALLGLPLAVTLIAKRKRFTNQQ